MKPLPLIAILLSACSSVPRAPEAVQRVCHEAQARFNVPDPADRSWLFGKPTSGYCGQFVTCVRPQLAVAGATDIRELEMTVAGQSLHHVALRFHADGRDWLCDNRRLAHAFGDSLQDELLHFVNPFHDAVNVTLIK